MNMELEPELKPKSKAFQKMISQHKRLKKKYAVKETEKQIKEAKKDIEMAIHPQAQVTPEYTDRKTYILINLLEKQNNELKQIMFEFETRLIAMEEKINGRR